MVLFSPFIKTKWDRGDLLLFCELNEQCNLISFAAATKIIEKPREYAVIGGDPEVVLTLIKYTDLSSYLT